MRIDLVRKFASIALAGLMIAAAINTGLAHHAVLRFNIEEMTQTADRIFVGQCISVERTRDMIAQGNMAITRYTFQVERVIKGKLPSVFQFAQLGHAPISGKPKPGDITMHGQTVTPDTFIHGMSAYGVGDRMLLFLIPNYLDGKVTYPVGLYQGAFSISRMPSGQDLARNGINNVGLFNTAYNGTSMIRGEAKVVLPERDNPLADSRPPGVNAESLVAKRGALPVESILGLVDHINKMHGGSAGLITSAAKGVLR
jgi:hypothetical protein